jgi:hypothetical protein
MLEVVTLFVLLGLTIILASAVREPMGATVVSTNWDGPDLESSRITGSKRLSMGKSVIALSALVALAFAFAMAAAGATHAVADTVNWNGATSSPSVSTVNWNGATINPTADTVNWNGATTNPTTDTVNWNGATINPTADCVNWNGAERGQG